MQDVITFVWTQVADGAKTVSNHRTFSKVIWDSASRRMGSPGIPSLKPKLMLRQFADEMPTSDERGALLTLAFGEPGFPQEGTEALELLSRSYAALHEQVLRHLAEIELFTDSAVTSEAANGLIAPYAQYETWLFKS